MRGRRIAAIALSGALVAGGAGAAIAAVARDDPGKAEQAVLDDAAKRLDVTPQQLRDALSAAQDAQLDQAVKDGRLTQKQADAIKAARKRSGHVLGGPGMFEGRGPHRFGMRDGEHGPRGEMVDDLAKALGTTHAKLVAQLRAGTSLAAIAKANGKTLAEVRSSLKATAKQRLDKAVADGDLTRAQADEMLAHIGEHIDDLGTGRGPRLRGRHEGPPPPGMRPGSFAPGDEPPALAVPAPGTFS